MPCCGFGWVLASSRRICANGKPFPRYIVHWFALRLCPIHGSQHEEGFPKGFQRYSHFSSSNSRYYAIFTSTWHLVQHVHLHLCQQESAADEAGHLKPRGRFRRQGTALSVFKVGALWHPFATRPSAEWSRPLRKVMRDRTMQNSKVWSLT